MSAPAVTAPRAAPIRYRSIITATFRPAARWSPEIRRHDGVRCSWRAIWVIGDGPFAGQWALVPQHGRAPGLAWAPESELVDRATTTTKF